ncbi:ATP-dependent endonuclease [Alloscardovia venturai]|uniref:ATP-dependent endonuclease n=1 Tax=Alloscardovia venturai TaxID=1769421 RepID=A0ABW2Y4Z2_9BIFI
MSALFDAQFVYSDLNNNDYQDLKKTKILGKLLSGIASSFQNSKEWEEFKQAHKNAFGEEGFRKTLSELKDQISGIMAEEYGDTKVDFRFDLPTIESFFQAGNIYLEDNGISTIASDKGTGMQRALALSLIQVYAQRVSDATKKDNKPLLFFLDEPETFLHPKAQTKLIGALRKLSKQSQIFITTHSPYLLRNFNADNDVLTIFSRRVGEPIIKKTAQINMFPGLSPTWGEINYVAFGIPSIEFHIELFGYLHQRAWGDVGKSISSVDEWFAREGAQEVDSRHTNKHGKYTDKTWPSYIRNYFDHPGPDPKLVDGMERRRPTMEEVECSIKWMLKLKEKKGW